MENPPARFTPLEHERFERLAQQIAARLVQLQVENKPTEVIPIAIRLEIERVAPNYFKDPAARDQIFHLTFLKFGSLIEGQAKMPLPKYTQAELRAAANFAKRHPPGSASDDNDESE